MPDDTPYVPKDPNDLIRSGDWNEIQIRTRREIHDHARHTPPIGSVFAFAGDSAPQGYLLCDGSAVSLVDYPELFAVVGTIHGGNGQPMFMLPDLRGRVVAGAGAGPGLTPRGLAQSLGAETHTLTESEVPVHTHKGTTENAGAHGHGGGTALAGGHAHSGTTGTANAKFYRTVFEWPDYGSAANHQKGWAGGGYVDRADDQFSNADHTHNFNTNTVGEHQHPFYTETVVDHAHAFITDGGTGGGQPHSNMQPSLTLNYIIRY